MITGRPKNGKSEPWPDSLPFSLDTAGAAEERAFAIGSVQSRKFASGHLADYAVVLRLCIYRLFGYARRHSCSRFPGMKYISKHAAQSGKLGWFLLWLLGVPIPILLFLYLIRGCT